MLMLYQYNYFVVSVKLNISQRQTYCIDDQDKFECVTDIDNVTGILPFSLHAFMKTLKSNISEAYEVQVDCLKELQSDSYDKNDLK